MKWQKRVVSKEARTDFGESRSSVTVVADRARGGLPDEVGEEFVRQLLSSRVLQGERSRYEAPLPPTMRGLFQLRVGTLRGGVSSSTFRLEER